MLGTVRRTTRTDVGLALALAGISYVIWVFVMGTARGVTNALIRAATAGQASLPGLSRALCNSFAHAAWVFDLAGVLWLVVSLVLITGSSRQVWIISWPWLSAICQAMVAAVLAIWSAGAAAVALAADAPAGSIPPALPPAPWGPLYLFLAIAMVTWVGTLVWLLLERARLRRGPSHRDSLRTHVTG